MEDDEYECVINKQKDANDEVAYNVPRYFNAFKVSECGRKLLDRLEVSYERECMDTAREEYFTKMLYSLLNDNEHHGTPLSCKKSSRFS